jgi:sulfite exporter TauE/SafE
MIGDPPILIASTTGLGDATALGWPALLGSVFVASLLGSLHCVGMCGGLATLSTALDDRLHRGSAWHRALPGISYHVARGAAYVGLGAIAGTLGAGVDLGARLAGWGEPAAWIAGLAIIGMGLGLLLAPRLLARWRRPGGGRSSGPIMRLLSATHRTAASLPPVTRGALLGGASPFLPCGWLYAFVAIAAGTGATLGGAGVMLAFWAGTVPALAGLATGVHRLSAVWRDRLPRLTATALVAVGLMTILWRGSVSEAVAAATRATTADATTVDAIGDELPPCCRATADPETDAETDPEKCE